MSARNLRACLVCSLVQPASKFTSQGCPNCDEFLEMRGSSDVVSDCTSGVFEGLITISNSAESWVAKWQRLQGYVEGLYAVKVEGLVGEPNLPVQMNHAKIRQLPEEYVTAAENAGIKYIPYVVS